MPVESVAISGQNVTTPKERASWGESAKFKCLDSYLLSYSLKRRQNRVKDNFIASLNNADLQKVLTASGRIWHPSSFLSPDSVEDELELSAVRHRPEGLEQLEAQTRFSRKELQILYRGFKNVSGQAIVQPSSIHNAHLTALWSPL